VEDYLASIRDIVIISLFRVFHYFKLEILKLKKKKKKKKKKKRERDSSLCGIELCMWRKNSKTDKKRGKISIYIYIMVEVAPIVPNI